MGLKKLILWAVIAFGVFFLISSPRAAAEMVRSLGENAGEWFSVAGKSLAVFIQSLG